MRCSSAVEQENHNLLVAGSNPAIATINDYYLALIVTVIGSFLIGVLI